MAILVQFKSYKFGSVENGELDTLIAKEGIFAFKRESGWVKIGNDDPIRRLGVNQAYKGPERRAPLSK